MPSYKSVFTGPQIDERLSPATPTRRGTVKTSEFDRATYKSVSDMVADPGLSEGQIVRTAGYYTPGDGGGNDYEIVAAGTGSNYGFLYEQLAGSGLEAKLLGGGIMEDKTVLIPTDYATLQEAVDDLSKIKVNSNSVIYLNIEAGHALTDGVHVNDGDFSKFYISAQDAVVLTDPSFPSSRNFVKAIRAHAPALDCLVDMGGRGAFGYEVDEGSVGHATPGSGVHGADVNLQVTRNSHMSGVETSWQNATFKNWGRNLQLGGASSADLSHSNLSGSVKRNIYVTRRSTLNFASGVSQNCQEGEGLYIIRSTCNALESTISNNAGSNCLAFSCSQLTVNDSDLSGAGHRGLFVDQGSTANAGGINADNCGTTGVRVSQGAVVSLVGASGLNAGTYGLEVAGFGVAVIGGSSFSGTSGDKNVLGGGIVSENGITEFGGKVHESGSAIVETYTSGSAVITKYSDGRMSQEYQFVEAVYQSGSNLMASITWEESFVGQRPILNVTAYHQSASGLPTTPSYYTSGGVLPAVVIRTTAITNASIHLTAPSGTFVSGDNAYISVTATGFWK